MKNIVICSFLVLAAIAAQSCNAGGAAASSNSGSNEPAAFGTNLQFQQPDAIKN